MLTFNSREELAVYIKNEVITSTEALDILQCSRQNLSRLIKNDIITPIKDLPRDRIFFKEDIVQRKNDMDKKSKASS